MTNLLTVCEIIVIDVNLPRCFVNLPRTWNFVFFFKFISVRVLKVENSNFYQVFSLLKRKAV